MENYIQEISRKANLILDEVKKDGVLVNDLDLSLTPIRPYCKAEKIEDIRLIIIGQDPTVRDPESRKKITSTLNLDKRDSLRKYLELITRALEVDLDREVYATNLFKCFFKEPPADDEKILSRHFKYWKDLICREIQPLKPDFILTLGEPVFNQLSFSENRKVKHYWNYIGQTQSGEDFKCMPPEENYLNRKIYPLPHQPSWARKEFYKKYMDDYLAYVKKDMLPRNSAI